MDCRVTEVSQAWDFEQRERDERTDCSLCCQSHFDNLCLECGELARFTTGSCRRHLVQPARARRERSDEKKLARGERDGRSRFAGKLAWALTNSTNLMAVPQITTRTLVLELDDPALPIFFAQLTSLRDSLLINLGSNPLPFNISQDLACAMPVSWEM